MPNPNPQAAPLTVEWTNSGPAKVTGAVYRMVTLPVGAEGKYGKITQYTEDWARISYELVSHCATLQRPHQSDHEIEGYVEIDGKRYSAFTSAGEAGEPGYIIVRDE